MNSVRLGRTGLVVQKNGFGALPIQRISQEEAGRLLRKAFESGVTFFDTARFYTDSEAKIGFALADVRSRIVLASKTMTTKVDEFWKQLETSLGLLKTDYLDIYQFHNPAFCPKPGDGSGLYEAMLEAQAKGMVRHIGITNHRLAVAREAAESGLYATVQFPFSYLAADQEIELVRLCREREVGFIAMKALAGGLITNAAAAYAWLAQYDNVLPIWGVQREAELDEFLSFIKREPALDQTRQALIAADRQALSGGFCRGCGYCLPCPANIDIPTSARMSLLIRRAPVSVYLGEAMQKQMARIDDCIHCDQCKKKCPYGLDTPRLLAENWADYQTFM